MTSTTPDPCRAALAELVAVKDIKERAAALHFAGPSGPLGEGWMAEWRRLELEYIERQPKAWAAARAALAQEAPGNESINSHLTDSDGSQVQRDALAWLDSFGDPHRRREDAWDGNPGSAEPIPLYALPLEAAQPWRDIATAPRERMVPLLLWTPMRWGKLAPALPLCGYWMDTYWVIVNADAAVQKVEPTHWMPLPQPPSLAMETGTATGHPDGCEERAAPVVSSRSNEPASGSDV
jgi:hypothetical protein